MWFITAVFSALFFGMAGFMFKVATSFRFSRDSIFLGLYLSGGLGFSLVLTYEGAWGVNWPVIIASALVSLGSVMGNTMVMKAYRYGPASLTAPLINLNLVIIIILSVSFFGEHLTIGEVIGIILILIGATLISFNPKEKMSIEKKIWLVYVTLGIVFIFMREGGLKITSELGMNNHRVLAYAYLMALLYFFMVLIKSNLFKNQKAVTDLFSYKGFFLGLLTGVFSALGLTLLAIAINTGPASIVMPIFSLRSFVIVVLSVLIYKEQLNRRQVISLALILVAVILLSPK
ncbi:EamA family transporter [Thiotrichales bacterium 19S3-7]|nr:EamA family transporter [Thiotrichales bacterium 19S3-7]MCF6802182.1 EamA family transporter [Thiotrichales bacterium 19S3-11]